MAVQVSYPGVYIDEFAPGAPIEGVGTSTAALIGPTERGDIELPTKVTNWEQFRTSFGADPLPGFYTWFAARGFFENGGTVCYVVRTSNGTYSTINLDNRAAAAQPVLRIRARQPGAVAITLKVDAEHALTSAKTSLYQPTGSLKGTVSGRTVTVKSGKAALFKPGDVITIAALGERAQIVRVSGDDLTIAEPLANPYADGNAIRLADTLPGTRTFRIAYTGSLPAGSLNEGTMLTTTQGATTDTQIVDSVQTEYLTGTDVSYRVTFRAGAKQGFGMAAAATVQSEEFAITITAPTGVAPLSGLSLVASHPNYVLRKINDDPYSMLTAALVNPPPIAAAPLNLPATLAATALTLGAAENLATLADGDYVRALDTLRSIDDVNLIAIPDRTTPVVQQAMIVQCEQLMDRFAVLDGQAGLRPFGAAGSIEAQRHTVDSARGYAGLYYPWLQVAPAFRGEPLEVPPSGHICGVIARSDQKRGVHKAPANEFVNGAFGVAQAMGDIDHGQLNMQGINVVRVFQGGGRPIVYGARTTATDKNWQYVNIRRLFLFLEESIQEGIRWAVFEPNNLQLWQKLRRSIGDFLNKAWRDGALFGAKAEDAYYVRIDEVLNPFSEQQLGRLNIEIGVRPTYPAEFIIVRIGIWAGGSDVSES